MKRRLTITIVGTVAVTLVLVGLGLLVLTSVDKRRSAEDDLRGSATAIATLIDSTTSGPVPADAVRARLRQVQGELRLSGAELVIVRDDQLVSGIMPGGLMLDDLDLDALRSEQVVSGSSGSIVFAAATGRNVDRVLPILVLTTNSDRGVGRAFGWFLAAATATLVLAVLVASRLSQRLVSPLVAANAATDRMARGDLTVRIPPAEQPDDELGRLTASINELAESLERSRGLERQFLMSVSHDLRTPLTSIQGYAEAIADGAAPDPVGASTIIAGEARRLERLVSDLLELAKLDARRFSMRPANFDLADLVADAVAGFAREVDEIGLHIEVTESDEPVLARADPDRVVQIVANLIENAMKFAAERVQISTTAVNGMAELVVADDGPGIADEDLPHVFDRLYVTQQTPRRKEAGSGLGLAIVRELTETMGGRVSVTRRSPHGTRFVVDLPPASDQSSSGSVRT